MRRRSRNNAKRIRHRMRDTRRGGGMVGHLSETVKRLRTIGQVIRHSRSYDRMLVRLTTIHSTVGGAKGIVLGGRLSRYVIRTVRRGSVRAVHTLSRTVSGFVGWVWV